MKKKICIITTVHRVFDVRIFYKEARTLAKEGYDVTLIAQHDKDEIVDGVKICSVKQVGNRFYRMLLLGWKVYRLAMKQDADIYHFHDPEFLIWAVKIKKKTGAKVIYDIHEYVSQQILRKNWIPKPLRNVISKFYEIAEKKTLHNIDWIILAVDSFLKVYKGYDNVSVVKNYPILTNKLIREKKNRNDDSARLIYVGRISRDRGIFTIIHTARKLREKYHSICFDIIGPIDKDIEKEVKERIEQLNLNQNVNLLGRLPYPEALQKIRKADIGLCIIYATAQYVESLPTKLFEYMTVGLPVVTSNFPLWKEIVEGNDCGLTVSPLAPKEISEAVEYLIEHPEKARKMGKKGRKAVIEKYNWETEGKSLIEIYRKLIEV